MFQLKELNVSEFSKGYEVVISGNGSKRIQWKRLISLNEGFQEKWNKNFYAYVYQFAEHYHEMPRLWVNKNMAMELGLVMEFISIPEAKNHFNL